MRKLSDLRVMGRKMCVTRANPSVANNKEYLLREDGGVMLFDSKVDAENHLRSRGIVPATCNIDWYN